MHPHDVDHLRTTLARASSRLELGLGGEREYFAHAAHDARNAVVCLAAELTHDERTELVRMLRVSADEIVRHARHEPPIHVTDGYLRRVARKAGELMGEDKSLTRWDAANTAFGLVEPPAGTEDDEPTSAELDLVVRYLCGLD